MASDAPLIPDSVQIEYLSATLVLNDPAYQDAVKRQAKATADAFAACKANGMGTPRLVAGKLQCNPPVKPTPTSEATQKEGAK